MFSAPGPEDAALSDEQGYARWLSARQGDWESLCRHCGACCGALEDPCQHLFMTPEGRSCCLVYPARIGPHRTVAGKLFTCVHVRQKLGTSWPGDEHCGYKKGAAL